MKKVFDSSLPSWQLLRARAFHEGAWITAANSLYWDIAGKCEKPVVRTLEARPGPSIYAGLKSSEKGAGQFIDLRVPCRKCGKCLSFRSWLWRNRAAIETLQAKRTWFCTYTIRPDDRFRFKLKARLTTDMTEVEATRAVCSAIGKEFTKYLKRIRTNAQRANKTKTRIRFLLVYEAHKDGYPHLHALIHEVEGSITKALIQGEWPFGFTNVKLCDENSSRYVTKYLAKSMLARVRASLHYGSRSNSITR